MKRKIVAIFILALSLISASCENQLGISMADEKSCNKGIIDIQENNFDYILFYNTQAKLYRISGQREAFIGTPEDGIYYDGSQAFHYSHQKGKPLSNFTFEQYDTYTEELLAITKNIIRKGAYCSYADKREEYKSMYYYYIIEDTGLAMFPDVEYEFGKITGFFRNGEFKYFKIELYQNIENYPTVSCEIGVLDHTTVVAPSATPLVYVE